MAKKLNEAELFGQLPLPVEVVPKQEWLISLPLRIKISKKREFLLNLNVYRNADYRTLSVAKLNYAKLVLPLVKHLPQMEMVGISYRLFPASMRLADVANICCIVDKFFSDTLVEAGRIKDDNYTVVPEVSFKMGKVDPTNPRVEATIFLMYQPEKPSDKRKPNAYYPEPVRDRTRTEELCEQAAECAGWHRDGH